VNKYNNDSHTVYSAKSTFTPTVLNIESSKLTKIAFQNSISAEIQYLLTGFTGSATYRGQDAELSQRDGAAERVVMAKSGIFTGTGRQYLMDIIGLSSTIVT